LHTKYQIVTFGPGAKKLRPLLERRLRLRIRELGKKITGFVRFTGRDGTSRLDPKAPLVGIYFGGPRTAALDRQALRRLHGFSAVVLPVVTNISRFRRLVPRELYGVNGIARDRADRNLDAIANLVLENLGLLRRSRRLFISYRRSESSDVALQIRYELDARGYDIFLDTHSVPKGDQFQEVLWHRLADSDLMLLLDSPGFLESRWTLEELAQAEAMTVGILQIVWPGYAPARYSDLCERVYLNAADFNGSALRASALVRISVATERLRARCLAARHDNLVREFCDAADTIGVRTIVQPERYVLAKLGRGRRIAAVPAVGVPDAFRYHEASRRFPSGSGSASEVLLVYDHRGLRPGWLEYLKWLDQFLPVKAARITGVADWLLNT
jgi:TIR domain